jgi:hypothetical protein
VAEGEEYGVEYSARAALEASVQAFCDRQVEPVEGKTGAILMKSKTVTEASAKNNLEAECVRFLELNFTTFSVKGVQRKVTEAWEEKKEEKLREKMSAGDKARLLSYRKASVGLTASRRRREFKLSNQEMETMVQLRLGSTWAAPVQICNCPATADWGSATHFVCCGMLQTQGIERHNLVRDVLVKIARDCGYPTCSEPVSQAKGTGHHRPDVLLVSGGGGELILLDVTFANPSAVTRHSVDGRVKPTGSAAVEGAAANDAGKRKNREYIKHYALNTIGSVTRRFLPIVLETSGRLGEQAKLCIQEMAAHADTGGLGDYQDVLRESVTRVTMAAHKGNAIVYQQWCQIVERAANVRALGVSEANLRSRAYERVLAERRNERALRERRSSLERDQDEQSDSGSEERASVTGDASDADSELEPEDELSDEAKNASESSSNQSGRTQSGDRISLESYAG